MCRVVSAVSFAASLAMFALLAGCSPPPLTDQPARDTSVDPTADSGSTDTASGDVGPPPSFDQVANIIRANCAEEGCHAGTGQSGFAITNGSNATDQQVRNALDGQSIEGGDPLVVSSAPTESALYQVLIPLEGRTQMPFQRDPLPQTDIRAIRRWIAAGASYE